MLKNFNLFVRLFVSVLFLFALNGFGQSDLLKSDLGKSFKKFDLVSINTQQALTDLNADKTFRIQTSEREFGLILEPRDLRSARFRAEDTNVDGVRQLGRTDVLTFKGYVQGETKSKVRINVNDGNFEGFFVSEGKRFYIEPAKNYSTHAKNGDVIIYTAEDYLGETDFDCHSDLMKRIESGKSYVATNGVENFGTAGVLELATDADFQFVTELGGAAQANTEILHILNMADGVFEEQLNLNIEIVFQHTWSSADSYSGSTPELLAASFKNYWNANYSLTAVPRDAAHLFSGKSNAASQGYAYIGAVCRNAPFAYGISGRISWEPGKFLLTTHELGHNVGGNHAEATQGCGNTIMNSTLSGSTPLNFCEFSRNEVGNFVVVNGSCLAPPVNSSARFDFDGDSKTDIAVFRPTQGEWWYSRSSDTQVRAFQFGTNTDKMIPADYTGDGKTDVAIWRESSGEVFVLRSEDNSFFAFPFGSAGDIPAPGDFDGDSKADFAVFRPSTGVWYISRSSGGIGIFSFGINGDIPMVGDYDGDGFDDIAILRPGSYQWWMSRSSAGVIALQFGADGDKFAPADFTGDGKTDMAFWRPSNGHWYVLRSEDFSYFAAPFGSAGDIPAPGDYDGDGRADFAVFRPSNQVWYISGSQSGFSAAAFGTNGDIPVPSFYIP